MANTIETGVVHEFEIKKSRFITYLEPISNKQAAKDRIKQDAAYEINLKIELEIMRLHDEITNIKSELGKNHGEQ